MSFNPLLPRFPVPALNLPLTGGGRFVLGAGPGEHFDLLVFYRGLHCPICTKYLLELERLAPEFANRGVQVVAISSDTEERGRQMADKVNAKRVKFAWGLSLRSARQWGLYISTTRGKTSIGVDEPVLFSEPGVFLVRPDGTLLLRRGADHALRAAAVPGPAGRDRFRDRQGLSGARRVHRRSLKAANPHMRSRPRTVRLMRQPVADFPVAMPLREPKESPMKRIFLLFALAVSLAACGAMKSGMTGHPDGLIAVKSPRNAKDTMNRLEDIVKHRGLNVFARIDHAAGAAKVGKTLRPTEVLVFGNPQGGTPMMECAQSAGIDLPLKALVWEDASAQVWLGYNDPAWLAQRHGVPQCPVVPNLQKALSGIADAAVAR